MYPQYVKIQLTLHCVLIPHGFAVQGPSPEDSILGLIWLEVCLGEGLGLDLGLDLGLVGFWVGIEFSELILFLPLTLFFIGVGQPSAVLCPGKWVNPDRQRHREIPLRSFNELCIHWHGGRRG